MSNFAQGQADGLISPPTGGDGDRDDAAAMALWNLEAGSGVWHPPAWHATPQQLQSHARVTCHGAYAMAEAHAGMHSNPPAPPSWQRPF